MKLAEAVLKWLSSFEKTISLTSSRFSGVYSLLADVARWKKCFVFSSIRIFLLFAVSITNSFLADL